MPVDASAISTLLQPGRQTRVMVGMSAIARWRSTAVRKTSRLGSVLYNCRIRSEHGEPIRRIAALRDNADSIAPRRVRGLCRRLRCKLNSCLLAPLRHQWTRSVRDLQKREDQTQLDGRSGGMRCAKVRDTVARHINWSSIEREAVGATPGSLTPCKGHGLIQTVNRRLIVMIASSRLTPPSWCAIARETPRNSG